MLAVCISLKASPWRAWPVWFLTFPSRKAKKGYFWPFIAFIEYTHAEKREPLYLELRTLSGVELCALQRAAWNSSEICWKCLENSRPCSPRRAPSITGLAGSLCSLAATLSRHKSLLPSSLTSVHSHSSSAFHSCISLLLPFPFQISPGSHPLFFSLF